ncbi:MAG: High molecular weight rubredoxin [bacterium ADurb.Bin157]|nr:MAG: High molecular weight rubredoxin [bacterium ADurb.Bin157]
MDNSILHKLSYGLFVITARDNAKINGCIINTVMQVTSSPVRIVAAVNKNNYTHDLIAASNEFNISTLSQSVPFDIFKNFGFQCGRNCDKFAGIDYLRSNNGLPYLSKYANSFMSCKVVSVTDLGTHSLFLADVVDGEILSKEDSVTYEYYHKHIKTMPPIAKSPSKKKTVWRCTVCGYEYEGDELPHDYICPVCHQPASAFVKLESEVPAKPIWRCTVCGYEYEGDELPPDYICPVCHQPASVFELKEVKPPEATKTVWRCKICGFIYEGEELPADYICPVCKHPASDFEKITI